MKLGARYSLLSVVIGVTLGLGAALFTPVTHDVAESIYDRANPVVESYVEVLKQEPRQWRVVMYSKKNRDCRLLEVQAFDVSPTREVRRLSFGREDGAQPSGMPVGNFRSAYYTISPPPVHTLSLSFLHECSGRTVRTPVTLEEPKP